MANKVCKACGQRKIAGPEFFDKDVSGKLGFKDSCKVCSPEAKISYVPPKVVKVEKAGKDKSDNK